MYKDLSNKTKKISVIGLGYVGLPVALEFAKYFSVIGFDVQPERIEMLKQKKDPSREILPEAFDNKDIEFTANPEDLKNAHFHVVAVPTPIDKNNLPDLFPLLKASETVGKILKKDDYVVFESTVYPGCTEEDCVPVLEKMSGLKFKDDFKVGYSPERINPGDKNNTLSDIIKIVSGCDDEAADNVEKIYATIIKAGVHRASSIKVAEAAKVIENTQRDVNIALMNELSMIFNLMGVNTYEVLEAAQTKWNFVRFIPGLVGGHCIGVDPYYLLHKAKELGYHARIINSGRAINDAMGAHVAEQTVKRIIAQGKEITSSRVLVMGFTFKEDVSDIRNTRVIDIVEELERYNVKYDIIDYFADKDEVKQEYGVDIVDEPNGKYDAIIVAVNHAEYKDIEEGFFANLLKDRGLIMDVKGIYRSKIKNIPYWTL